MAWTLSLGLVAALGSSLLVSDRRDTGAREAVHETIAIRAAIAHTLSLFKDAETGQRGFVLTGADDFLVPYSQAMSALPQQLEELRRLASGDALQASSVRALERLAREKQAELVQTIELQRRGRSAEALAIVRGGRGQRLMEMIREEIARMQQREATRLAEREREADSARRRLTTTLAGVWGFFLCVVAAGIWSASRGIREAQLANARLEESEKEFRRLADNATDLVRVLDEHSTTLYVSPSCERILGFSEAEVLALPARALVHDDQLDAKSELIERIKRGDDDGAPFVHRLRRKDGSYHWFETSYRVLHGNGGEKHIYLTSRDIEERKILADQLRQQSNWLESILASMGDGVVVLDEDGHVIIVNPAAQEYITRGAEQRASANWPSQRRYSLDTAPLPPSDRDPLRRALAGEACDGSELTLVDRSGRTRTFSVSARPIVDGGAPAGCVAVYRDVTEQHRAELELQASEERLRVLSAASFEGVAITKGGTVVDSNESFAALLGRASHELLGEPYLSLFAPEDQALVAENGSQPGAHYEASMVRHDGARLPVEVRDRELTFRQEVMRISVVRDVTDKRQREAELKERAELLRAISLRDELTGLYNRRGFLEHAQQGLRHARRSRRSACVFFADLNRMKAINDTFGHEAGDRAIVMMARLLEQSFREADIIGRLGGDEFAIFAPECSANDVAAVRQRLRQKLEEAKRASNEPFQLATSVGCSEFSPESKASLDALMEAADRAMYEEKRAGSRAEPAAAQAVIALASGPRAQRVSER